MSGRRTQGLEPFGPIAAEVVADLRFRRRVQQVHRLGDRVLGEFLAELGVERSITTLIDQKLDTYAEIEPEALEVAGGDRFPPAPLYEIQPNPEPPVRPATAQSRAIELHDVGVKNHAAKLTE